MKKSIVLIAIISIAVSGFAQSRGSYTPDSIVMSVANELGPLPDILPYKYNDTELKGKFQYIFGDKNMWDKFAIDQEKQYRWINAPETKWYDKTLGPDRSDRDYIFIDTLIMVDSTVTRYYNTMIKGYDFDYFKYEVIEQPEFGTTQEYYTFYKKGSPTRYFLLGWNGKELGGFIESRDSE